jgi:tRNA(Ile)-lysidine synthase
VSAQKMLERVRGTLLRHGMAARGDTVVVGVSGGVDSVTLLDLLTRLGAEFDLKLVVLYVDHGLRGEEAAREERFVQGLASRYGVPFECRRIGPSAYRKGTNLQAEARRLRVRHYEEVARRWRAGRIATGHHRDDHLETLLMQILRGTGGLRGIRPTREGRYIRPLIETRREEIESYAQEMGLAFCEDSSNRSRTFLRNRIRQELIPWICREVNPSFSEPILQLASILEEEGQCLDAIAEEAFTECADRTGSGDGVRLGRDALQGMPRAIQRRVLRHAYRHLEGSTQGLSYAHVQGICDALDKRGGRAHKVFSLPRGIRAFLEYDAVHFSRGDPWEAVPFEYTLLPGEELRIPEAGISIRADRAPFDPLLLGTAPDWNRVCLDADLSCGPMVVRNIRAGDRFRPLGLGGEKSLKDFLADRKIPRSLRRRIAILDIAGRVGWVVGHRIDDRFKVSDQTRHVIRLQALAWEERGTPDGKAGLIKG